MDKSQNARCIWCHARGTEIISTGVDHWCFHFVGSSNLCKTFKEKAFLMFMPYHAFAVGQWKRPFTNHFVFKNSTCGVNVCSKISSLKTIRTADTQHVTSSTTTRRNETYQALIFELELSMEIFFFTWRTGLLAKQKENFFILSTVCKLWSIERMEKLRKTIRYSYRSVGLSFSISRGIDSWNIRLFLTRIIFQKLFSFAIIVAMSKSWHASGQSKTMHQSGIFQWLPR